MSSWHLIVNILVWWWAGYVTVAWLVTRRRLNLARRIWAIEMYMIRNSKGGMCRCPSADELKGEAFNALLHEFDCQVANRCVPPKPDWMQDKSKLKIEHGPGTVTFHNFKAPMDPEKLREATCSPNEPAPGGDVQQEDFDLRTVITWQTPGGEREINICEKCEDELKRRKQWPRDVEGQYCRVSYGEHEGTCHICFGEDRSRDLGLKSLKLEAV